MSSPSNIISLAGKTALVTGGNTGIGRAIALELARAGADVAITSFTNQSGETAAEIQALGRRTAHLRLDATKSDEVNHVVAQAAEALGGRIDILVNNAGPSDRTRAHSRDERRALAPGARREPVQRVLLLARGAALYERRLGADREYVLAGGAQRRRPWRGRLWRSQGWPIRADARPGQRAGPAGHQCDRRCARPDPGARPSTTPSRPRRASAPRSRSIPLKRGGTPEEVAGTVLYLVSDLAGFVTGEVIEINGGAWFV